MKVRAKRILYFLPDREAGWVQRAAPTGFTMNVARGTPGVVKDERPNELLVLWDETNTPSPETALKMSGAAVWTVRASVEIVES